MSVLTRNNVKVSGPETGQPMIFAHGFGCDQNMWRFVTPAFEDEYRVVLFDHVGAGRSDISAYNRTRYASLQGYADDVLEICRELGLARAIFVGHSVAAMIGVLAALQEPDRFDKLVLVGPSPRYIDEDGYAGGFSREDIEGLLDSLDSNYLGWSSAMAPVIMGQPGPSRARDGADQQLLPHQPRDREGLRARHLPVRQPGRPPQGADPLADPAVLRGCDRPPGGRRVREPADARQRAAC